MTKSQLGEKLAAKSGLTLSQSAKAVDGIVEVLRDAFTSGDTITIRGFGAFEVKERAARVGRNLKTNEPLNIPATKVVKFKPFKELRAELQK